MSEVAPSVLDRLRALLASRYIDDGIDRRPTAVNLFPNGSFEYDTVGSQGTGLETGNGNVVTAASFSGSVGAKVLATRSDAASWLIRQLVPTPCTPGVSYTASVRYQQLSSNSNGWSLYLDFLDGAGATLQQTQTNVGNVGNGNTGVATAVGTAPAGAITTRLRVAHVIDISAMLFDGFMIAPTTQGTAYRDGDTPGWFWDGLPGNSTSETPKYPPTSDQILEAILGGIADGAERLGVVAFGDDTVPVGRALSDPSVAPDWALPHAALYTSGGLLPGQKAGESDAAFLARARDAAVYPLGIKAGTNEAIVRTVQPLLTGTKSVFVTVGSDPYSVQVRTLPAETPDQAAVSAAITGSFVSGGIRGALRAEMTLDYAVSNSPQFSEATRAYSAVAGTVTGTNVTRTDVT